MPEKAIDCEAVFRGFIKQYYHVLRNMPELRKKFYKENSSWTMKDGDNKVEAQGSDAIAKAFSSCPLNGARVDFGYKHSQMTHNEIFSVVDGVKVHEGVFILVYGSMEINNQGKPSTRLFQQAFRLVRVERNGKVSYNCLNDAFVFVGGDNSEPSDAATVSSSESEVEPAKSNGQMEKPGVTQQKSNEAQQVASAQNDGNGSVQAVKKSGASNKKSKAAKKSMPKDKQSAQASPPGESQSAQEAVANKASGADAKPNSEAKPSMKKHATKDGKDSSGDGNRSVENAKAPVQKKATWATITATAPAPRKQQTFTNVKRGVSNSKNSKNSGSAKGTSGSKASGTGSGSGKRGAGAANDCSLYVKEIPEKITENEVRAQFGKFGKISEIVMNKGYLFVTFKEASAAASVLASKSKIMLGGKTITVEKRKADGQKKGAGAGGNNNRGNRGNRSSRKGSGNSARGGKGGNRGSGAGRNSGNRPGAGSSRSRGSNGSGENSRKKQ